MNLTPLHKRICDQVANVFETGTIVGDYSSIAVDTSGPNRIRQITFGRCHAVEYGNLNDLIRDYVDASGLFAPQLKPFLNKIGIIPFVDDEPFKDLLREAGKTDPKMRNIQDRIFEECYFIPAIAWADANGFTLPLSALVIYDSYIQSGSVPDFLVRRYGEPRPINGGREKFWTQLYVGVREDWLTNHPNPMLQSTVYRTDCFRREIARGNWDLSQLPIKVQGLEIFGK